MGLEVDIARAEEARKFIRGEVENPEQWLQKWQEGWQEPSLPEPAIPALLDGTALRALIRSTDPALETRITGDTTGLEPVPPNRRTYGEEPRDLVPDRLLGYTSVDPNHGADRNNL